MSVVYDDRCGTYSGYLVRPLELQPKDVRVVDIAHALSNQCRFGGHCREFYSVAQHSVLVSYASEQHALWGLLHDAAEAYLVDVPRPLKCRLAGYEEHEARILQTIGLALGLRGDCPVEVLEADERVLAAEIRDLFEPAEEWPELDVRPWPTVVTPWPAEEAEKTFLARYRELTGTRK